MLVANDASALSNAPIRVMSDKLLGVRLLESTEIFGWVFAGATASGTTRSAMFDVAKYAALKRSMPAIPTPNTTRSGLCARRRCTDLAMCDTGVNRVSIEVTKCRHCPVSTGITEATSFSDRSYASIVGVCDRKFGCNEDWFTS